MCEESDVSNRHMTWWRNALVGPYGRRPTPTDGTRPSKSVASSHESRAGKRARQEGLQGEKGRNGRREEKKATQTSCTSYSTFPLQALQQLQQPQQQQQQQCACNDARGFSDVDHWSLQLKELANKSKLLFRHQKDFVLVQLCKLQSFGEGSSQVQDVLLLDGLL